MASEPSVLPVEIPEPILTLPPNITIRPYHASDAPSLAHNANNPAVRKNLRNRMPQPYTVSDSLSWITHSHSHTIATGPWSPSLNSGTGPKIPVHFAIVINGKAVGSIGLDFGAPDEIYARTAEVGYWLGEAYWGQGVMGKVVPAFVDWTWRTFGRLVRLNEEVNVGNVGSRRCLERAGMRVECVRERAVVKNGVVGDVVLMGMVRPEGLEVDEEGDMR